MDETKTVLVELTANELSLLYRHADYKCQEFERLKVPSKAWHCLRDKFTAAICEIKTSGPA